MFSMTLNTLWFDVALVFALFAVGNILFGHFEQHHPKWRRLLKVALFLTLVVALSATIGRGWGLGLLAVSLLGTAYIHLVWLPRNGVNGWTGEPRERYLALVKREA